MAKNDNKPAEQNQQVQTKEMTMSERFTTMVLREVKATAGSVDITDKQKRMIANYFLAIDRSLKTAEEKRLKKSEQFRDPLPVIWQNVNMEDLAVNVRDASRVGYDPALPNHISMVPYKNNTSGKYDIGMIPGYRGKEIVALKYGYKPPDDIIIELVFENDKFRPIKKDINNQVEGYTFEVAEDPFNRGEIKGGFFYHRYKNAPEKNRLVHYTKAEIEKRKPKTASAEFWGGEKEKWSNNQRTGEFEKIEGWYQEMMWKTVARAAYGAITLDGDKIDEAYQAAMALETKTEAIPSEHEEKPLINITNLQNVAPAPAKEDPTPAPEKNANVRSGAAESKQEPAAPEPTDQPIGKTKLF